MGDLDPRGDDKARSEAMAEADPPGPGCLQIVGLLLLCSLVASMVFYAWKHWPT